MSHNIEQIAYAGETPWHGLGVKIEDNLTPAQMLKAAGLDWKVERVPLKTVDGTPVTSHFGLRRDTDQRILGICGSDWKPTQNSQAFKFFDKFTRAGSMKMDTAGSLRNGQLTWALASLQKGFTLAGGDEVKGYCLLSNPHVWGKRIRNKITSVRVVCNNTLDMALVGKGEYEFAMTHVREFTDELQEEAKATMGLATEQLKAFEDAARHLSKRRYNDDSVMVYLTELLQPSTKAIEEYRAKVANANKGDEVNMAEHLNRRAAQVLGVLETQPGANMKSAKGTYWGLLNAVTYVVDHKLGWTQDARLDSAWFGPNANLKKAAMTLAIDHADKYGKAA